MRKDLNMRKGKMVAQGAHASLSFLSRAYPSEVTTEQRLWLDSSFAKICLCVNSEQELDEIFQKAVEANLVVHLIVDSGKTEFHNIPTKTCLAIGPHYEDKFVGITDHLPLL